MQYSVREHVYAEGSWSTDVFTQSPSFFEMAGRSDFIHSTLVWSVTSIVAGICLVNSLDLAYQFLAVHMDQEEPPPALFSVEEVSRMRIICRDPRSLSRVSLRPPMQHCFDTISEHNKQYDEDHPQSAISEFALDKVLEEDVNPAPVHAQKALNPYTCCTSSKVLR